MNFKSLPELLDYFKEEATGIAYYEEIRWGGNPVCPHCSNSERKPWKTKVGYKCSNGECNRKFTVKVGTIFENSKIPFRTWFAAIYLCTAHKKGISSVQLAIDLGITQKTAWFVLHRIREMLKNQAPQMLGETKTVEVDEAYIGGLEANRHTKKRRSEHDSDLAVDGTKYNKKKVVVGLIERDGKVVLKYIPEPSLLNMVAVINQHVPVGSKIYSDEHVYYNNLKANYTHNTVCHSLRVYVSGDVHTNTIENFWSVLKRGLYGIYHQVSNKHLERYLNEFAARFNSRDLKSDERFNQFLRDSEGALSYKALIG